LARDWAAFSRWDISKPEGIQYLSEAFGEDYLLEVISCWAPTFSPYRKDLETQYMTIKEYFMTIE